MVTRVGEPELMDPRRGAVAVGAAVRPATNEDLDELVAHTWAVAAEGRWTGVEVPFDRDARRARLGSICSEESSTVLVADTAASGGPGIVGYISVEVARYGVADIGMLVIAGWRGRGLGHGAARRRHGVGVRGGGSQDGPRGVAAQYVRHRALSSGRDSSRRGASAVTTGAGTERSGTPC